MEATIRQATIFDCASILNLIQELADYEKEPQSVKLNISDIERHGFGKTPLFRCLVAELNNEVIGMALFYPITPVFCDSIYFILFIDRYF